MSDAKQYARKLLVVSLSDKGGEEKKKEEETVKIDLVGLCLDVDVHCWIREMGSRINQMETKHLAKQAVTLKRLLIVSR